MSNLYIYDQGSVLSYKENRLVVNDSKEGYTSIPIENIDNVVIFGGVQTSTACMQHILINKKRHNSERRRKLFLLHMCNRYINDSNKKRHNSERRRKLFCLY